MNSLNLKRSGINCKNSMTKLDTPLKLKLLFTLLMSNFCVYILSQSHNVSEEQITEQSYLRKDYTELKLYGDLMTSFTYLRPITILSKSKRTLVKYALLLQHFSEQNSQLDFQQHLKQTSYLIYLPNKDLSKVLGKKNLIFIPYRKNDLSTPLKKKSYEVLL